MGDGFSLTSIRVKKESSQPWSYNVFGDQNCQGYFYSQYSTAWGLNFWFVNWDINSIHTSLEYHVKIMDAPSSIQIDGNYYILYAKDQND